MTTAQKDSIVQRVGRILDERIALVRWFRQNACAGRNLPFEENSELRVVVDGGQQAGSQQSQPTVSKEAAQEPKQPTPAQESKDGTLQWLSSMPGWMKGAAMLAAGAIGTYLMTDGEKEIEKEKPAVVESTDSNANLSGSLLQDLEDRGFHLAE